MTAPAADSRRDQETIPIIGLDCEDCARTLAHGLKRVPGVLDAEVSAAAGSARIAFAPGQLDRDGLVDQIEAHGYRAGFANRASDLLVFDLLGLDCADCARSVESAVSGLGGVGNASVNFGAATLQVTPAADAPADMSRQVAKVVDQAGFEARLRVPGSVARVEAPRYWRDRRFLLVLAGFVAWVIGFAIEHGTNQTLLADAIYLLVLGLAGSRFVRAAWLSIRARRIDMNVLMTVSAVGAAALGD